MKLRKENPDEIVSLLGEGVEMCGEISFARGLLVDGIVKGKIRSEGSLMVGAKGRVEAEAAIQRISINGEFRGIIYASERVEIRKDGKVFGEIFTPCLIIEAGALFEGKCNMSDRQAKPEEGTVLKAVENNSEVDKAVGNGKPWAKRKE